MEKEILAILMDIKNEMSEMKSEMSEMKCEMSEMKGDIRRIDTKLDETYQIVKALEHSAEVNKSEHDKMGNDIAHIKGDVSAIKKDVTNVEVITASNWADIAKLKAVK